MAGKVCESNVVAFNAAIRSREKWGEWQMATV